MRDSIEEIVVIEAPPSAVWEALTDAAQLEKWYAPGCRWDVPSLTPGAVVVFHNTATDQQRAHVESVDPLRELTLSWEIVPDAPHLRLRNTFLLDPIGSATRVTISQAGYDALPIGERDEWRAQDERALVVIAEGLRTHVERRSSVRST